MNTCKYYKGTEQVGADSTRILCSYMTSGGKTFKNNDPESAALIQCCWHAEKAEKECPLLNDEIAVADPDKRETTPEDEEDEVDVDGIEFNEGNQLRALADEFRKMTKMCPYFAEKGEVKISVYDSLEFECELTTMIFAKESKAGEWLERCCSAPEKCYHFRKAKEKEGQPMEQQTFTTEIAEKMDTTISTERQDRAVKLTRQIIANGSIAANSMIEMGRDLKAVRDERLFTEMGFGTFEEYCEKKIGIGKRHGYNFISVYERFGEEKLNQLQGLGITKLLEIAKLDDEDAEDLMRNNDVSGLSTRELSAEVEKYKNKYEQLTMLLEEEKSKNAESASLESQVEELKRFAAILNDDYNKALKEKAEAIKEHQSEMKKLTADRDRQINELKKKQTDYEELEQRYKEIASRPAEISEEERNVLIQQGRDEMCKKKDEDWSNAVELAKKTVTRETTKKFTEEINSLKILNDELRKNADSAKESTKKYKDEVEKLKAENATLQSNVQNSPAPAPMSGARDRVKFYLSQIKTAFISAIEALDEAEESEQEALRNALRKAIDQLKENINAE